jgi:large subunit ribosomal protein L32
MAVPFRRTSKTAKRKRRTHFKLSVPGMVVCPNCGEMKLSHRVCKECGHYAGKVVLVAKEEEVVED